MLKRRRIIFCAVSLTFLSIAFCFHLWLSTGPLRRAVLARISQSLDGHVDIDRVSFRIGGGLILKGVTIRQSSDPQSTVVCEIPRIDLNGSVWKLLRGEFHPMKVTIRKPTIHLAQADDGTWLTKLPFKPLPTAGNLTDVPVQILDAQLELLCRSSPEQKTHRRFSGINLEVMANGGNGDVRFSGQINDPLWNSWNISGRFDPRTTQLRCRLHSSPFELQPQHVEWAGLSLTELCEVFQPKGQIAIDANILWEQNSETGLEYQILLDPQNIRIQIPTLHEAVEDLTGRVEITTNQVRVHGLVGSLVTGAVVVSGTVSREQPPEFDLTAEVRRLPLARLGGDVFRGSLQPEDSLTGKLHLSGRPDPQTWTGSFDGSLLLSQHQAAQRIPLHLSIKDGLLNLTDLAFGFSSGQIAASGHVPIQSDAIIEGSIDLQGVDLQSLCATVEKLESELQGSLTGRLSFRVPLNQWTNPRAWKWNGPVQLRRARFGQIEFESLNGTLTCQNQLLTLQDGTACMSGRTFRGDLKLALKPPYTLSAQFQMEPVPLGEFASTPPGSKQELAFQGKLEAAGRLTGRLKPVSLQLGGTAFISGCSLGKTRLGDTSFKYQLAGDGFDIRGVELSAFEGRVRASGRLSWDAEQPGPSKKPQSKQNNDEPSRFRLSWSGDYDGLDIAALRRTLKATDPGLGGRAKGRFQLLFAQKSSEHAESFQLTSTVESKQLRLGKVTVENVKAELCSTNGTFTVPEFSADSPAGKLNGTGRIENSPSGQAIVAQVSSQSLSLEQLAKWLGGQSDSIPVKGSASGQLSVRWELADGKVVCQGTARVSPLVLDGLPTIDQVVTKQLEIRDNRIVLRGFQATLWGGSARGTTTIDLTADAATVAEVVLDHAQGIELTRLLEAWPASAGRPSGKLAGAGRFYVPGQGSSGDILGTAEFDLDSAVMAGLPVNRAEGTLEVWNAATHELASGRVQPRKPGNPRRSSDPRLLIKIRDSRAARGNIRGAVIVNMTSPITYDTNLQFTALDLSTVARSLFASPHAVAGTITGDLRLHSTERGMADATAEMHLRLQNANLWPFPLFAVLAKVLSLDPTKSAAFHTAEVRRATLQNGVLDFQEFWLASDVAKLFGQGTVGLDGKLNLEVVSNVDTGVTKGMPVLGSLQNLLNNFQRRLVKLRVTGTLDDPVAVPVPLQDLSEPALKFFKGVLTGSLFEGDERGTAPTRR